MITQRQSQILAAIVKEYSQKGRPIGSEELTAEYHFEFSPATMRNEMKILEAAGLITQPHTSAGRLPTDKGYRYFVNKLMQHLELSRLEQSQLRRELLRLQQGYLELGRSISKLLSEQARGAAFALLPESVGVSGLAEVVEQDVTQKEIREVAKFLDDLEGHRKALLRLNKDVVETFIGRESAVPWLLGDLSLMVKKVTLPDGRAGIIGIVGPKRMKYARNISLLEYVSRLLRGGLSVALLIFNF